MNSVMILEIFLNIKQGTIWQVEFFPNIGSEIGKKRPAIVVSHDKIGKLPLKTILPITNWSDNYINYPWMIKMVHNDINGLSKTSAIDCFQIRNFSHNRFIKKIGIVDKKMLDKIHQTIVKTLDPRYKLLFY